MSTVLRAVSVANAPFWAWWLAPAGVTAVVAVVATVAHRERRRDRHEDAMDDYGDFRRAMERLRGSGGRR
jgi:membrane protein implicated in regulation of membrane protease activity